MRLPDNAFWKNKRVFVTGHTGFKGSWLCLWLHAMGAKVTGYSLPPQTTPSLFGLCGIEGLVSSVTADIRDKAALCAALKKAAPQIIFHLAAQPLVKESYSDPVTTYETNVLGTVYLLEAARRSKSVRAIVNVTTDKCYENRGVKRGYRENEPLGGVDPYSNSKACSELATAAYRSSFFNPGDYKEHGVALATARAGNVIGGGDWSADRIVPDCMRALMAGDPIVLRHPRHIRPWQHVLEPLSGYLLLAEKLWENGPEYAESWNFGPAARDCKTVEYVARALRDRWNPEARLVIAKESGPHEAARLGLDCSKARTRLGWRPRWDLQKAIAATADWYRVYADGRDVREECLGQIDEFEKTDTENITAETQRTRRKKRID